ncbi:MFS transporter [Streptomyces olivoreticuli]|uniref:MFS transporter n=1 Tax=Streptomyces olivoreticuli TaxID=68246 RepID=UPI00265A1EDF|nr:MFS transporter [Streptomyces olivoreticuli]WKK23943.1 MFS transporter [Streptomyces olivoreticuli]
MNPGSGTARHSRVILVVVCTGVFMAMLDNLAVTNALPTMGEELNLGISGLQWAMASYTLVLAATLLSAGTVGDLLGQRRAFLCGLMGFMAGSAIGSAATSLTPLVAGRALQGLGAAVLLPAGAALLRHTYPDGTARARALGVRGAAGGLGVALGPAVGGPLTELLGWRSVLWVNLPIGAVALLLALRVLPRPPATPVRWDPVGQALAVTGLGGLVYGVVQGPVDGWRTPGVVTTLAVAAVALPAFAAVETRVPRPLLDLALFHDRTSLAAAMSCFSSSVGLFGGTFFFSLYLQDILGWSAAGAGAVFLSASAFIALTAPASAALTIRRGIRAPLALGLALNTLVLLGLSYYGQHATYASYGWLLPALGAGTGLLFIPTVITLIEHAPADHANTASAVVDTLREVGGVLGVATLGALLTARMRLALHDRATDAGLSQDAAGRLVRSVVTDGSRQGLGGHRTGEGTSQVTLWVESSFVDGLHLALRCGALVLACTLVVVLVLLRRSRTSATPAREEHR